MDTLLLPLAEAAAATYAPGGVPWFQNSRGTCQVYRSVVDEHPCYAFEGTATFREWLVDFFALDVPIFDHSILGPVHLGFWIDIQSAIGAILAEQSSLGWPSYYLAGHSKGAGEAVLGHALLKSIGHPPLATRAFEPPMVGTAALLKFLADENIAWTQTCNVHGSDIITLVPDWPEWCHVGAQNPAAGTGQRWDRRQA